MSDDLLSWLKATIEGDKAEAEALPHGPWIVSVGVRRYPQRISNAAALLLAETYDDPEAPPDVANYIAKHDPRDTIARCESELAILDEYEGWSRGITKALEGDGMAVADPPKEWQLRELWVHRIAHGYRNRPGWKDGWDPTPAHVREWLAGAEERRKLPAKPDDMEALKGRLGALKGERGPVE